jgi:hypothetical protein
MSKRRKGKNTRTSKAPRFPSVTAPIWILDDGKPLHLPVALAKTKLLELYLHIVLEICCCALSLLCPGTRVMATTVEFVPDMLGVRHKLLDAELCNRAAILASEES